MAEKEFKFDGIDNYIDFPILENPFPVLFNVKIPKEPNRSTLSSVVAIGNKKLRWNQLYKFIKDEQWHHISWDGTDVQIDGKFYKL